MIGHELIRHTHILSIVGNIVEVQVTDQPVKFGDIAFIDSPQQDRQTAQIVRIHKDKVHLQVFGNCEGISTHSKIVFPQSDVKTPYSNNVLGRVFSGLGVPRDGRSSLKQDDQISINGANINPSRRVLASKMIRTNIPLIDVFNCLVESQKIPIFASAGEPHAKLLARIGMQSDADLIVFGGIGLLYDDYHFFRQQFDEAGVISKTVMYVHLASDPIAESLLIPDTALALAEKFAVQENKRVLVLLTDMTSYADALKEIGISLEHVPSNRGYMGDLYSQLAKRYEKASDFKGAGSVTILSVTTMPGDDVTHPVPDNTGYITEGQFYLRDGMIDPFGSLSRLKQNVIGKVTRDDHNQVMNTMIRLYSDALEAQRKQSMAFDLSDYDKRLIEFGHQFRQEFMRIDINLPLESALDRCWELMAKYFKDSELHIKSSIIKKYLPTY